METVKLIKDDIEYETIKDSPIYNALINSEFVEKEVPEKKKSKGAV